MGKESKDYRVKIEMLDSLCEGMKWQDWVLARMSEGWSVTEVISHWRMTRENHGQLRKNNEEYGEVFEHGEQLCEAWWMKLGRENIQNQKNFHMGIYAFHMKNRFGWRDTPLANTEKARVIPDKTKEQEHIQKFKLVGNQ